MTTTNADPATFTSDTIPECPSWCTLGKGHEWTSTDTDGTRDGWHSTDLVNLSDYDGAVRIRLEQNVAQTPGQELRFSPIEVAFYSDGRIDGAVPLAAVLDALPAAYRILAKATHKDAGDLKLLNTEA